MDDNFAEYIQDISFNDSCDRMVISTTCRKVIIYKKVKKSSEYLISKEKKEKKNLVDIDNFDNDKMNKTSSSKSKSSDESYASENEEDENSENFFFLRKKKSPLYKSLSYADKNKLKIDMNKIKFQKDVNIEYEPQKLELDSNSYEDINENNKIKEFEYTWEKEGNWNLDGPVLRIQWANREYGNIFACSGYNKWVYIFKEVKKDNNLIWEFIQIKSFSDSVIDISFLPKKGPIRLASATSDGHIKISEPSSYLKTWVTNDFNIYSKECSCLCCNPSNTDLITIVVGCKKNKNSGMNLNNLNEDKISNKLHHNYLIKIVGFNSNLKAVVQPFYECDHEDDITDIDWANPNGRTYHLICSTSKDGRFIIWEINLFLDEDIINNNVNNNNNIEKYVNFFKYKNIFEYRHNKPLWRCSFNDSGVLACCIDEDGETFVFLKTGKTKFIKLDIYKT